MIKNIKHDNEFISPPCGCSTDIEICEWNSGRVGFFFCIFFISGQKCRPFSLDM